MSKTISLLVNGQSQTFEGVGQVDTALLATDKRQRWIPKDEAVDHVNLVDITPTENGIYRIAQAGETARTIHHDDGTVEQIIEADGIKSVTPNVPGTVTGLTTDKNGTYDAKNYDGRRADGFNEGTISVENTAKQQTCRDASRIYKAQDIGVEGFEKIIVDVKDPLPEEPYQIAVISENGEYDAEDRNGYGFFLADVNIKKEKLSTGWMSSQAKQLTQDIQYNDMIDASACMINDNLHIVSKNKHFVWQNFTAEESSMQIRSLPRYFIKTSTSKPCLVEHNGQLNILGGNGTGEYLGLDKQHWILKHDAFWSRVDDLSEAPIDAVEYKGDIWYYTATGKLIRLRGNVEETMLEIGEITGSRICVYHDRIYIIGGYADTEENPNLGIISFHPIDGMRQEIPQLPYMLVEPELVVHDDRLRILGSKLNDNPLSKKYFTDLVFSENFIGYGTHFAREAGGVSTQYPFMANYVNCFECNGTLHAVGVYYTNDGLLYDWILTEEEL